MNPDHLLRLIIRPTLEHLGIDTVHKKAAEALLLATAAVESECGYYLEQKNGPALGIFQMEPNTHDDIWVNWLQHRDGLHSRTEQLLQRYRAPMAEQLVVNPMYACAMARMQYRRSPLPLPADQHDLQGAWKIYKDAYNTHLGATTWEAFQGKWERYVA